MGIYARFMAPEDQALYAEFELGKVDNELRLMRVRLARTVKARTAWEASLAKGTTDALVPGDTYFVHVETIEDEGLDKEGSKHDLVKKSFRLPDFDKIEQACLARIESLEKTRLELFERGQGDDPPEGEGSSGPARDRVAFTGGLGGTDDELPSPFAKRTR